MINISKENQQAFEKVAATLTAYLATGSRLHPGDSPATEQDAYYYHTLSELARELGYTVLVKEPPLENMPSTHPFAGMPDAKSEGMTHTDKRMIWLSPESVARPARAWRLFAHELCHALRGSRNAILDVADVSRFIADAAGDADFDPTNVKDMARAIKFALANPDAYMEAHTFREEWIVELACALTAERLGLDYRFAIAYIVLMLGTVERLERVLSEAAPLADRLVAAMEVPAYAQAA